MSLSRSAIRLQVETLGDRLCLSATTGTFSLTFQGQTTSPMGHYGRGVYELSLDDAALESRGDLNDLYIFRSPDAPDGNGQGTHVAGTIGAEGNNSAGASTNDTLYFTNDYSLTVGTMNLSGAGRDILIGNTGGDRLNVSRSSTAGHEVGHLLGFSHEHIRPAASGMNALLADGSVRVGGWGSSMYQYAFNDPQGDAAADDLAAASGEEMASPTIATHGYIKIKKLNSGG